MSKDKVARKAEFYRYYSAKRTQHQLKQLEILKDVPAGRLTEIGPYLGFATGLFMAAGFTVQTIDGGSDDVLGSLKPEKHIPKNITDISVDDLKGQDVVVCCEVLEHLEFSASQEVLNIFQEAEIEWLLVSVPYRCLSIDVRIVKNPFSSFFNWFVRLPDKQNKTFEPHPDPHGHKWELGYKGYPLSKLTDAISAAEFEIVKTDYVGTVRSVLMLCKRRR